MAAPNLVSHFERACTHCTHQGMALGAGSLLAAETLAGGHFIAAGLLVATTIGIATYFSKKASAAFKTEIGELRQAVDALRSANDPKKALQEIDTLISTLHPTAKP